MFVKNLGLHVDWFQRSFFTSSSGPTHLHAASIVEGGCKPAAAVLLGSRRRQRQPHIGAAEALRLRGHGHRFGILYLWRRLGLACTHAGGSGCVAASSFDAGSVYCSYTD